MSPASLSLLLIQRSHSQVSLLSMRSKDSDTLPYAIITGIKLARVSMVDMIKRCLRRKVVTILSSVFVMNETSITAPAKSCQDQSVLRTQELGRRFGRLLAEYAIMKDNLM